MSIHTKIRIELWRKDPVCGHCSLTTFTCSSEQVVDTPKQERLRDALVGQFNDVIHSRIVPLPIKENP